MMMLARGGVLRRRSGGDGRSGNTICTSSKSKQFLFLITSTLLLSSLLLLLGLPGSVGGVAVGRRGGEGGTPSTTATRRKFVGGLYLPEEDMDVPAIVEYYGYPVEVHKTTTFDGYILQMHRIPFGRQQTSETPHSPSSDNAAYSTAALNDSEDDGGDEATWRTANGRPVFFLQHGLLSSSADWVTNLPSQSLAFLLADAGFDVWMGNVRGNYYSARHKNLTTSSKRFWDFTWDEMSQYDLPAMIDTVLETTGQRSLYYVGHSQGTEILFVKLASDQKFGKKIRKFFALAPVSTVGHIEGLIAFIGTHVAKFLWLFKMLFGEHDFLPHAWFTTLVARLLCGEFSFMNPLCDNVLFQIGGPETSQFNQTRLMVYLAHTPAGTSTWNILHWAQMQRSGTIQRFDYGSPAENRRHYGPANPTPPLYNLSAVNVPTYLYYSDADWLADSDDVKASLLGVVPQRFVKLAKNLPHFNHFDFIWGLRAHQEIYPEIIAAARDYSGCDEGHLIC